MGTVRHSSGHSHCDTQVADLNSLLKSKLNISDAPVMMAGAAAPAPAAAAPVEVISFHPYIIQYIMLILREQYLICSSSTYFIHIFASLPVWPFFLLYAKFWFGNQLGSRGFWSLNLAQARSYLNWYFTSISSMSFQEEEEAAPQVIQTSFTVKLNKFDASKKVVYFLMAKSDA